MKNDTHKELWSRIQQFRFDEPHAATTFSGKLAAKQNWSATYTERVIEEYRRFLFLCCISPTGASPSQVVDEAWHLHLTYTRSYWTDLCANVLGQEIHHHPSKGGDEEEQKHHDWYCETLDLYRSVFKTDPPTDIWPAPRELPVAIKRAPRIRGEIILLVVLLLMVPFLISAHQNSHLFPFAITGPEFLGFFPVLCIAAIVCYIILQNEKYRAFPQMAAQWFPEGANAFDTAQLMYGRRRVVQAAIVDLIRRNLLVLQEDNQFVIDRTLYKASDDEQNPLINAYLKEESHRISYEDIEMNWELNNPRKFAALQRLYELANTPVTFLKRHHVLLIPFVIALARIIQGAVNDKPVGYLLLETLLMGVATVLLVKGCSGRASMNSNVTNAVRLRYRLGILHQDRVVGDFAIRGNEAITNFSDGLVLIGIFGALPFVDRVNQKMDYLLGNMHSNVTGSSGSSSCGSGGSGCSGGGCGGGCGGCGS